MLIKSVHIEGFWNKYSLDLDFNSDVNLFSGINGSGKTTLLNILYSVLRNRTLIPFVEKKVQSVEIIFMEDYRILCKHQEERIVTTYWRGESEISAEEMPEIHLVAISTFDTNILNEEQYKQYLAFKKDKIRSELDLSLDNILNQYYKYLAFISREVENTVKNKTDNLDTILSLYDRKSQFIAKVNELFAPTKKTLDDTTGEILFRLEDGTVILPRDLSSGEKQLLSVLFSTLIQNGGEYIVFWDEPEISMHIDWQRALIRIAREINPLGQLLIATHSPSIIYEGWEKRVVNMEDLLK